MTNAMEGVFEWGNTRTSYCYFPAKNGKATVVCMNGLVQSFRHWYMYQEVLAKEGIGSLAYTLPGQVDAPPVADKPRYIDFSEHVLALCDYLEVEKIYLTGLSLGAGLALYTSIFFADRVEGLMTFSAYSRTTNHMESIHRGIMQAAQDADLSRFYDLLTVVNFKPNFVIEKDELLAKSRDRIEQTYNPGHICALLQMALDEADFTRLLYRIRCHTRMVCALDDIYTMYHSQKEIHEHIRDSQIIGIPNAGHAISIERADVCLPLMVDWARGNTWVDERKVPGIITDISRIESSQGGYSHKDLENIAHDNKGFLYRQAYQNSLSNVIQNDMIRDEIKRRAEQYKRRNQFVHEFSLAVVNVIRLAKINDDYDYETGDMILNAISRRLEQIMRGADSKTQVENGRFFLILAHCNEKGAEVFRQRILRHFGELPLCVPNSQVPVGIGFAINTYQERWDEVEFIERTLNQLKPIPISEVIRTGEINLAAG